MAFGDLITTEESAGLHAAHVNAAADGPPVLRTAFQQLQSETLMFAFAGVFGGSLALLAMATRVADPSWAVATAVLMLALLLAAWWLRSRSFGATSALLVTATLSGVIIMVTWGHVPAAVCLLAIPIGLTTVLLGPGWGIAMAAACTLALYGGLRVLPGTTLAAELLSVAVALAWTTVGLLWIVLRPLLTAVEWAWSHYEKSQTALEQTRGAQVQLKQVMEDLSFANVQLTRLNQLAHGLREEAEAGRRAKEEFVANVSHELRTPLNMIIGFSRMIVQTPQVYGKRAIPPALLSDLTVILRNSQHLSNLVDDVLDLSQIEADRMALTKERTDLNEIVETALTVVRPLFESKQLRLDVEIEDGLPALLIDRTRICEALLNLLSNAGRFTEKGGVQVRVVRSGSDVLFSVADTGPGIASNDMSKLFQPFQQLDDSLSRRHEGTGLGLTLSKRFVELHGGRMWLESNLGQGSTFYFALPVNLAPIATGGPTRWLNPDWNMMERTRPQLAQATDTRPRFVVLDGVGTLSRLVMRYLDGCEIVSVRDMPAAINALAEMPAQALLIADPAALDELGGQDGSPALSEVPADTPVILCPIPIMGLTVTPSEHAVTENRNSTALSVTSQPDDPNRVLEYFVKPVSQETLLAAVTNALHARDIDPDGPATILLVDDEPDELRLFWRMLAASGRRYRILTAGNGVEALAILREEKPDLVVSDLVMPEMDGFQLIAAKNALAELRAIPVVILSARDPQGQPIVAESVTAIRAGGLSIPQLLACIEALSKILSPLPAPAARRQA